MHTWKYLLKWFNWNSNIYLLACSFASCLRVYVKRFARRMTFRLKWQINYILKCCSDKNTIVLFIFQRSSRWIQIISCLYLCIDIVKSFFLWSTCCRRCCTLFAVFHHGTFDAMTCLNFSCASFHSASDAFIIDPHGDSFAHSDVNKQLSLWIIGITQFQHDAMQLSCTLLWLTSVSNWNSLGKNSVMFHEKFND